MIQPFDLIFVFFGFMTLFSATMVIVSKESVHSALFLIFCFVNVAALWMTLQSEFLSLALIFVYVGAVMTLMLFVVMMFHLDRAVPPSEQLNIFNLVNLILGVLIASLIIVLLLEFQTPITFSTPPNSALELGKILYTDYIVPFLVVSITLLIGMIGAVSITFQGVRSDRQTQNISEQIYTNKSDRIKILSGRLSKKESKR
ncbi:MAG: hypothetical protein CMF42_00560 [Legionellales bacterium]|nr:hypothetical protein [Legionellales bacterium]OUX68253.1 MAG: hypothetical protein CBD38_00105 [bacterium TMED178]|tara:strand:- start:9023 stop:9625 length:603 start_codon:yes stop_codon:yes gene_type:complete